MLNRKQAQVRVEPWPRAATRTSLAVCLLLMAGCAVAPPAPPPSRPAANEPVAAEPNVPLESPDKSSATEQRAAKTAPSKAKAPAAPASVAAPTPKKATPAVAVAKPDEAPQLDLTSLKARLRQTSAIGVFTKLALQNQVEELLDRFREFYVGRLKTSLLELRHSYDLLVLKVLALLQDADPPLAKAVAASRESIWGILANPTKFSTL